MEKELLERLRLDVEGFHTRLTALEAQLGGAAPVTTSEAAPALEARLAALESAVERRHSDGLRAVAASVQPPIQFPDLSGIYRRLDALEGGQRE